MVSVYVKQINQSLKQGLYFPALALALALPDMEDKVGQRYISWYDKYIGHNFKEDAIFPNSPCLSGELVYNLRNTYLHQGSPNVDAS